MKKIEADFSHVSKQELRGCHFSTDPFYENPGELVFSYDGHPVSPAYAKQAGYCISDALTLPAEVNSREVLGTWLTDKLGLDHNSPEFHRMYVKYADVLPLKYVPKPYKI